MKEWVYGKPQFECDKFNYDLLNYAPWSGHRNFAYDFINYFRPKVLVELGSHYGCSAFAFAQGVKDFELDTKLCFIDTWQGDDFTKKYDNDVYTIFSKTVNECYPNQNINMMRMTFNDANDKFENGSIDVLHIDGSHHYNDVKEDFEKWLPKVNEKGIILLHDISSDIVLGDVMGSYKYWLELQSQYKYTASFDFSWGLGIIFLDKQMYEEFINSVDLTKYQRNNNALDVDYKDKLRKNYFELKDKQIYIDDLLKQKDILNEHIEAYKNNYNDTVNKYEKQIKDTVEAYENDKAAIVAGIKETVDSYEQSIKNMTENTLEIKANYEETIKGKDGYISELESRVAELSEKLMYIENALRHPVKYMFNRIKKKK